MTRRSFLHRFKLRSVIFFFLVLSGIIPLVLSALLLLSQNRGLLQEAERDTLTRKANSLSREVDGRLANIRSGLVQLGEGFLAVPGPESVTDRLAEPWVTGYLSSYVLANPNVYLSIVDASGQGPRMGVAPKEISPERLAAAFATAFDRARRRGQHHYQFIPSGDPQSESSAPTAALAVPVPASDPQIYVVALFPFTPALDRVTEGQPVREAALSLIDGSGKLLWSRGASEEMNGAFLASSVVRDFEKRPLSLTTEYDVKIDGEKRRVFVQVSPLPESGWGIVVQQPTNLAFEMAGEMALNTFYSTLVLIAMALGIAFFAARRASQPIQRLAETTHEIAGGKFGRLVEASGVGSELYDLAEDFNQMSAHLEDHVQQLRQAAQANRELFIGSLRAFAAAIDAKDPYTRGHSERVAAVSRTIARQLQLSEELQHKVWIGALLHDVGKIGVDDRILKKGGVLSHEEFDQMKAHTVIGADILTPIEQLKDVIPAVRWHHESWNGRGYPDGLRGEQIPLLARVVAVADTFDAITTNRPYQQAYDLQYAAETIIKLAGSRFDAKVVTAFLRAYEAGEIRPAVRHEPSRVDVRAAVAR
jgi:putative nucleotidyltransferase with HDIG domain